MKSYLSSIVIILTAFTLFSCESSFDSLVDQRLENNPPPEPVTGDPGNADFSNYIAIGNSLTAGFMDAALYNLGQENSVPAIIAKQLTMAGAPESFNQPDINSTFGFNTSVEQPQQGPVLGRFKLDTDIPGPSPTIGGDPIEPYSGNTGELNNFGVPGALVGQLLTPATADPSNTAFNPFYARFASNPGTSTILGDAIQAGPTFFTLWIGSNDVLGYAVGGASDTATPLTNQNDFRMQFSMVINELMNSTSADGVVANIPPFLGLAFFRAVPYNAIPLDAQTATQLSAAYTDYNNGLQQAQQGGFITQAEAERRTIAFQEGQNAFVMNDETLTDLSALGLPSIRQSEPTDLQVLTLGSVLGQDLGNGPFGLQDPVTDNFVLIPSEQQEIEMARAGFNATILAAVDANADRLVLYDTNAPSSAFLDLFGISDGQLGINVSGVSLNADFSPNGVLSTDGVHPNPRGNAILANEFIRVIEDAFEASIPKVDVINLPSVQLCAGDCVSQQ